jgi:hypothetical protein
MARRLSIGRLRGGELLAGAGAVVLVVALWLDWFDLPPRPPREAPLPPGVDVITVSLPRDYSVNGWDALGWLVLALATLAVAWAAWLIVATAADRPVTHVVAADVTAAVIGPMAFVALALRALVFQPGANEVTTVEYGTWIGLAGAALLAVGAWWSLADERTGAPESAYVPPAPRPAPPPGSS